MSHLSEISISSCRFNDKNSPDYFDHASTVLIWYFITALGTGVFAFFDLNSLELQEHVCIHLNELKLKIVACSGNHNFKF